MADIVIAFTGLAGSGKTTAALHLAETLSFTRTRFAGPLKEMMKVLGLTDQEIDGNLKELPCELLGGKTPRWAMQSIGTEWGRDLIHQDLWVNVWKHHARRSVRVVTDDCRFANEAAAVRELGGKIIKIERPGWKLDVGAHPSEAGLADYDMVLVNASTPEHFKLMLDEAVARLLQRRAA